MRSNDINKCDVGDIVQMEYVQQLTQTQKLIMTPQLKQSIKILQLTSIDLRQFIMSEFLTNPVLEIEEDVGENQNECRENDVNQVDWKEYWKDYYKSPIGSYKMQSRNIENDYNYENIISNTISLQDFLMEQFRLTLNSDKNFDIAYYIINSLDSNGYLLLSQEEIAKNNGIDLAVAEEILSIVQTFEPSGIACRDLRECLMIQLTKKGLENTTAYGIIDRFIIELAAHKLPHIAKQLKISVEEVQSACDFIRTLEPKPGRAFSNTKLRYITPDAILKKINGEYVVAITDNNAPHLKISNVYKKLLYNSEKFNETASYINEKLNSASWLIKSIEQRKNTIRKVVEEILVRQKDFFEYGKKHLRPMTLKEIALAIEMHESTVSRATSGKYIETPRGIFELKYFFSSGIAGVDGEKISSESIKKQIKEIIAGENEKKPYSDNKIVVMLETKGIIISRRTVAKYRDSLGIVCTSQRRRY
ncbi:MAG: RNA polymerase factor sigma-54 [Alkaliphilus sp.]